MLGIRPVMELMFYSFAYVAFDQMMNKCGDLPIHVRRIIALSHRGSWSCQWGNQCGRDPFAHPGKHLCQYAGIEGGESGDGLRCEGTHQDGNSRQRPGLFMESTVLYGQKWEVPETRNCPRVNLLIPLGKADVKREGTDISLIGHGRAVITSLEAANRLESDYGISAEVVDLRSIRPLDEDTIWIRSGRRIAPSISRKTSPSAESVPRSLR